MSQCIPPPPPPKTQPEQYVKFRDPQSDFYTDGRVVAIHAPDRIEVAYRIGSWSHPK